MDGVVENVLALAALIPAVYGCICWIRRRLNALRVARWAKEAHHKEWNDLHWLARRNPWAGVEALIHKGVISGAEADAFRARDEYLEKAGWVAFFLSAVLLLVVIAWKFDDTTIV